MLPRFSTCFYGLHVHVHVNLPKKNLKFAHFQVPVTPTPTQALYANISILEHSCINNASKHFDGDNRVVIRAAVNIKKGEHISINYSDPMWGTANRQLHLGNHSSQENEDMMSS